MPVTIASSGERLQGSPSRLTRTCAVFSAALLHLLLLCLLLVDALPETPAELPANGVATIVTLLPAPVVARALPAPVQPAPMKTPHIELPEARLHFAPPDHASTQASAAMESPTAPSAITPEAARHSPSGAAPKLVASVDCLPLRWLQGVSRRISFELNYPAQERTLKHRGTTYVRVSVSRSGEVLDAPLLRGSGYRALDLEAQAVFRRIGRFAPVPSDACRGADIMVIDQPVVFGFTRF